MKAHQEDFKFRKPNMSYLLPMTYNGSISCLSTDLATKSLSPLLLIDLFHPDPAGRFNLPFTSYPIIFSGEAIVMVSIKDQELWLGPECCKRNSFHSNHD